VKDSGSNDNQRRPGVNNLFLIKIGAIQLRKNALLLFWRDKYFSLRRVPRAARVFELADDMIWEVEVIKL
jgi:hypothetical protein